VIELEEKKKKDTKLSKGSGIRGRRISLYAGGKGMG